MSTPEPSWECTGAAAPYEEIWQTPGTGVGHDASYTYAIVDVGGALKIDDAYWAGSVTLIDD